MEKMHTESDEVREETRPRWRPRYRDDGESRRNPPPSPPATRTPLTLSPSLHRCSHRGADEFAACLTVTWMGIPRSGIGVPNGREQLGRSDTSTYRMSHREWTCQVVPGNKVRRRGITIVPSFRTAGAVTECRSGSGVACAEFGRAETGAASG